MKKSLILLTSSVLCAQLYCQNISHADVKRPLETSQVQRASILIKDSTSFPWTHGITLTLDDQGTLHIPGGNVTGGNYIPPLYLALGNNLSEVKNIEVEGALILSGSAQNLFANFSNAKKISGLDNLNVSGVTDMGQMFLGDLSLENLDLSNLETKNVTSMFKMFENCRSLKTLKTGSLNTENVKIMSSMFQGCTVLRNLDLSSFDTHNLENMTSMFQDCTSLNVLILKDFICPPGTWMNGMLSNTPMLSELILPQNSQIRTAIAEYHDTSGKVIANNSIFGGPENEAFSFSSKVIPGYTFQKVEGQAYGILGTVPQVVTFIYAKN